MRCDACDMEDLDEGQTFSSSSPRSSIPSELDSVKLEEQKRWKAVSEFIVLLPQIGAFSEYSGYLALEKQRDQKGMREITKLK